MWNVFYVKICGSYKLLKTVRVFGAPCMLSVVWHSADMGLSTKQNGNCLLIQILALYVTKFIHQIVSQQKRILAVKWDKF